MRLRFIIVLGEKWFGRCISFEIGLVISIYKWVIIINILLVCFLCVYWLCGCIFLVWSFVFGLNYVSISLEIVKKGFGVNDMNVEVWFLVWNLEVVIDDWLWVKDMFESIFEIKKW